MGYVLDGWWLIPGGGRRFSLSPSVQIGTGGHPAYPIDNQKRGRSIKLTTHLCLMPGLRMNELCIHFTYVFIALCLLNYEQELCLLLYLRYLTAVAVKLLYFEITAREVGTAINGAKFEQLTMKPGQFNQILSGKSGRRQH
jgi:hypothetical protein